MRTTLQKGQFLESGFDILEVRELEELEADGIWARHRKSGAQVFHVYNDDPENLFSFAFTTIPEDNTGAAHILEHSVLCGSRDYPLKDAFLVLAQGSLNTFLNAWTFPDKTIYPASSVNEQDYFNLMAVYGDAVFRPLISEWTFMQEGHHLFFDKADDTLRVSGVVYNEMKGAYSSLDTYAGLWSTKAVLPGTPYQYESGGDPDYLPELSWEGLRQFHRSRYAPANCRIFLAGNIPTEKQLGFLEEKFFSSLEPGKAALPIPKTERWKEKRTFHIPCPAGAEQKSTVFLSFLCGDNTDPEETLDLAALTEILLGHDGSPLTRALIESGLGEDLSPVTGFEGEIRETVVTLGLRGVENGKEAPPKVEALIMNELQHLVNEGIPPEEIEAALLSMEFSNREIRRSGGPFSLVWMRRSLRSWIHGRQPWDSLLFAPLFEGLKGRLAARPLYFEGLIQKYFLDNPHRALVIIEPEKGFLEKKETLLAEKLEQKKASLSEAEKEALMLKNRKLEQIQEQPDSPEALSAIPHLVRRDLSPEIEIIKREYYDASGTPVIGHPLYTNGIAYVDLAFPADTLEEEDYPWLPFFSRTVVSLGLPGLDYGAVSTLLVRNTGGFHAMLDTGTMVPGSERALAFPSGIFDIRGRDWIIYRLKALDEKMGASLDLAYRILTEADFTDLKRIRDLILEMKNEADSSLAPMGSSYASLRSSRNFSRTRKVEESWHGLEQLKFVHKIAELETSELSRRLVSIRDRLIKGGLLVNLSGSDSSIRTGLREISRSFGSLGAPRPGKVHAVPEFMPAKPEIYASPSLQVGFAAMTLASAPFGSLIQSTELVLSHLLYTGVLWEEIRMKGGAYGAFVQPDALEGTFSFSTYRDPDPQRSLKCFKSILENFSEYKGDTLEKAVIGAYSRETRPRTPAEKGSVDFSRLLYGIEDSHRARRLLNLINTGEEDMALALRRLKSLEAPCPVIIAGAGEAEKAARALGIDAEILPV